MTQNKYILTIVDEYSRFPFAFPCRDVSSETVIKCLVHLFSLFGMPGFVHSDRGPSLISTELRTFLNSRGIATSRTSAYNPRGNGQVERYNGIVWKTISLALESRGLAQSNWEQVLADALHSIRSLLCTATNCTPHERLFGYQRRSSSGHTVPSWLSSADRAYLRKHVRLSKYDPLVEEVEVLHANPQYVHVRLPSGVESTVSIRDLAPMAPNDVPVNSAPDQSSPVQPEQGTSSNSAPSEVENTIVQRPVTSVTPPAVLPIPCDNTTSSAPPVPAIETTLRRSMRNTRKPARLIEEMCGSIW